MPNAIVTFKDAKEIEAGLKQALLDALGKDQYPDLVISVKKLAGPGVEFTLLYNEGTTFIRTALEKLTSANQKVAPEANELVALTFPDGTLRICIPVQGGYIYI